jgi:hypothetical protein
VPEEGVGAVAEVAISVVGVEVAVLVRRIDMFLPLPNLGMRVSFMESIGGDELTGSEDMELHRELMEGVA